MQFQEKHRLLSLSLMEWIGLLKRRLRRQNDLIRNENISKDKNVYIRCNKFADTLRDVLTVESTNRVIDFLEHT